MNKPQDLAWGQLMSFGNMALIFTQEELKDGEIPVSFKVLGKDGDVLYKGIITREGIKQFPGWSFELGIICDD